MTEALGTHWGLGTGRAYAHRAPGTGGVVGGGQWWWLVKWKWLGRVTGDRPLVPSWWC
jgi:hypothetical protein